VKEETISQPCPLIEGIGFNDGAVYWLERCGNSTSSTVYLVEDGTPVLVVPENETSLVVVELLAANSEAIYILKDAREYQVVVEFTKDRSGFQPEVETQLVEGYSWNVAFNEKLGISYACTGGAIVKYNTLNISENDIPTGTVYSLQPSGCDYLTYYNVTDSLYWRSFASPFGAYNLFYRGNATCVNCPLPEPFYNASGAIADFLVYDDRLYMAVYNVGIQSIPLTGLSSTNIQTLATGNVVSLVIVDGYIYYNDGDIKKISLNGSNPSNVSQSSPTYSVNGTCECEPGFTGIHCDICSASLQWNGGVPHCVAFNKTTGFPVSCFASYMCGNVPYAICNENKCECQTGPLGVPPYCDTCLNGDQITWKNGIPSCTHV
jgi:hypothetical protein